MGNWYSNHGKQGYLVNPPEDSLAKQVAEVQDKLNLPGLISEMKEIIKHLELPNVESVSKIQWKSQVNKSMINKNRKDIIQQSERYKKICSKEMEKEKFERKSYLGTLRMDQARTKFKIKTKMLKNVKLNFKNDQQNVKKLWQ